MWTLKSITVSIGYGQLVTVPCFPIKVIKHSDTWRSDWANKYLLEWGWAC